MEKSDFGIEILAAGLILVLIVVSLFFFSNYEDTRFEPRWEELNVNDVEFKGISGTESNSIVLYLENKNKVTDVVVKQIEIKGNHFNRTFLVMSEENNFPSRSQGQITLTNVGWRMGFEYTFYIFSSNKMLVGAITKTA